LLHMYIFFLFLFFLFPFSFFLFIFSSFYFLFFLPFFFFPFLLFFFLPFFFFPSLLLFLPFSSLPIFSSFLFLFLPLSILIPYFFFRMDGYICGYVARGPLLSHRVVPRVAVSCSLFVIYLLSSHDWSYVGGPINQPQIGRSSLNRPIVD